MSDERNERRKKELRGVPSMGNIIGGDPGKGVRKKKWQDFLTYLEGERLGSAAQLVAVRGEDLDLAALHETISLGVAMQEMLERLEWSPDPEGWDNRCQVCKQYSPNHAPDCELSALLKRAKSEQ